MLLLQTGVAIKGKTNTYTDRHHPKYQWRPQIIKTNEDQNIIH